MTPTTTPTTPSPTTEHEHAHPKPLRIYSHSSFIYWWPVWFVGFILTAVTYMYGTPHQLEPGGHPRELIHSSSNLGVVYFAVMFVVILITNLSVRGLASVIVLLSGAFLTLALAYFGWWDAIFTWFGDLSIHMTLGSYFWFSTLLFVTWVVIVFGVDRVSYWEVTPGQFTRQSLLGAGSHSYNTQGMAMEKHREDLFRHWLLGFGSGDLRITTSGAIPQQINMPNVTFVGFKVVKIQRLISSIPDGDQL